ncbi:1281_t:CDS:2 [Paraglomus occultum]|uniref:1281_t:CDS:1 n=1 Tax=Paraglomus occultum TaxID=144539 RepID=A0A9N8ZYE3_9GLOM|nr:1281_t:CDS:2 [Paraglomus occultum]
MTASVEDQKTFFSSSLHSSPTTSPRSSSSPSPLPALYPVQKTDEQKLQQTSSKLRQIAPAPPSPVNVGGQSDYSVYHIPKGFEVIIVPKTAGTPDGNNNSVAAQSIPKIPISPVYTASSTDSSDRSSSPSTPPSSTSPSTASNMQASSWRKRQKTGHIPRPKNCFMAYRESIQHKILKERPGLNNKIVSIIAAQQWNRESPATKNHWREVARQLKEEHQKLYPNYKFAPKKKIGKNGGKGVITLQSTQSQSFPRTVWGHYRSSSVESFHSFVSDSSTFASPPTSFTSPPSPTSYSSPSPHMSLSSSSPLRYEAYSDGTHPMPFEFHRLYTQITMPSLQLSEFPFESNDLVTPIDVESVDVGGNDGSGGCGGNGAFFDNSAEYGYDDFMTDDDDSMRGFHYLAQDANGERMGQGILEQQCRQERMCQQQHALVPFE